MISAGQADKIAAPKFAIDGASENPPARLLILPWGESSYDGGTAKLVVDGRSLALIPEAQRNSNFDKLALDFNHNSIPGSESYTGEPVKVAAYGLLEIVPNDGIYLANLEWTADGEKAWRGGYYRDISPAVLSDRHGVVYFVHSAALCRNGRIPGLEVFAADFLKPKTKATMDKYKQMVCRLLGVAEDTDDATIESAFERAVSEVGKKTDDIQKKQKPAAANKNARYGASVGQMERQQNKIKELLGSDSRADISRGAKMAERFEKRYGISINDDVREYKGIDRKTGKFVNPTSKEAVAQSDAETSQRAYGIAARAGAIKTPTDVVRPIAGAVGSAASAAVGAVSETAGMFSTGGVPAPRSAKSYSARMTEKAAGAADEFSTGGVPAPRSAKSFSERLAESRAPKSAAQKTQSAKASGKSGDSDKGAGGGIDEAVSSLSELAKQIDTLVKKIIDLEKNVKGSVSRLSKK